MTLTPARLRVLAAVGDWWAEYGYGPTVRDLCGRTGHTSSCTGQRHVEALECGGYISRAPGVSRSIRLTDTGRDALMKGATTQ